MTVNDKDDYSDHFLKGRSLTRDCDIAELVGELKFDEASARLHRAAIAFERASILVHRLKEKHNATKRDSKGS